MDGFRYSVVLGIQSSRYGYSDVSDIRLVVDVFRLFRCSVWALTIVLCIQSGRFTYSGVLKIKLFWVSSPVVRGIHLLEVSGRSCSVVPGIQLF